MADTIEITPIGYFRSPQKEPYEAGRQPDEHHSEGVIELAPGNNFEQALIGLKDCPRVWVIFQFHHNPHWNPMVLPPRGRSTKIGVFATRSPYRPNGIGMSCVEVLDIDKLSIRVAGADILDGSPILDIKPYVAYADAFPGVEPAWLQSAEKFEVEFSELAFEQLSYLRHQGLTQLESFLRHQLEYEPTNSKKKRISTEGAHFVLAYKTWRARFTTEDQKVMVLDIYSGYSEEDMASAQNPYQDKEMHSKYRTQYRKN